MWCSGSRVGALAVVGALLAACATLAAGLAHDVPPRKSRSQSPTGVIRARNRSRSTMTRRISPVASSVPPASWAATWKRTSRPSVWIDGRGRGDLGADRARGQVLEVDPRADAGLCRLELERGAGRLLAPGQHPGRAEDREVPAADSACAVSASVTMCVTEAVSIPPR